MEAVIKIGDVEYKADLPGTVAEAVTRYGESVAYAIILRDLLGSLRMSIKSAISKKKDTSAAIAAWKPRIAGSGAAKKTAAEKLADKFSTLSDADRQAFLKLASERAASAQPSPVPVLEP